MKAFYVLCVLFSAIGLSKALEWPCPADWSENGPCYCDADDATYEMQTDCSNAKTDAELEAEFGVNMPMPAFIQLDILQEDCEDCAITHFTSSTFGTEANFQHVNIHDTQLNIIDDGAFVSSHGTLRSLTLSKNNIDYFPFDSMGQYDDLQTINLNANNFAPDYAIVPLSSESLKSLMLANEERLNFTAALVKDCPSITYVQLSNVGLSAMEEFDEEPIGMFTGLQNIARIDFSRNSITYLRSETIVAEAKTLTEVNFSNNLINVVEASFVKGFTPDGQNILNFANNKIDVLDEAVWRDVFVDVRGNGAGLIDLTENPILCGCDIAWLARNQTLMNVVVPETTCEDGQTLINSIPPGWFDSNC